jgi:hypothetical protein
MSSWSSPSMGLAAPCLGAVPLLPALGSARPSIWHAIGRLPQSMARQTKHDRRSMICPRCSLLRGNGRRLDLVHRRRSDPRPGNADTNSSECGLGVSSSSSARSTAISTASPFLSGISIFNAGKPLPGFLIDRIQSLKPSSAIEAQAKLCPLTAYNLIVQDSNIISNNNHLE